MENQYSYNWKNSEKRTQEKKMFSEMKRNLDGKRKIINTTDPLVNSEKGKIKNQKVMKIRIWGSDKHWR